ncbi:TPA: FkbM family methyltransferase [Streptococcus equi subsp. zooepidemicus]|nr:FkbM family methyltransferase [Streptococcus equi subsp. zooepidemicus]
MEIHENECNKDIIKTIDLDSFLSEKDVTLIKMDIEGSEYDALMGAKRMIIENMPKLAICIYHTECHLWDIPLLIKEFVPEYKLYIRHYGENYWDTICYAVK